MGALRRIESKIIIALSFVIRLLGITENRIEEQVAKIQNYLQILYNFQII
jgi:hypothetical protein